MFWLACNNLNNLIDISLITKNGWVNLLIHSLRFFRWYVRSVVYFPVRSFVRACMQACERESVRSFCFVRYHVHSGHSFV